MSRLVHDTPLLPLPTDATELERCLSDPEWRLFSGCLYKIMIKGDAEAEQDVTVLPFRPNAAQVRFIRRLWYRNVILKARQLGFTTLICILWLDHALFNADQRCGIIAQDLEAAGAIFRDKVKFAYDNLPSEIRERFPLKKDSASELLFKHNNSSIRVATSMRSGTIHRLLISEFGKICAKYRDKAEEVMTGSIPAVPTSGILVIESTAEGQEGEFYEISHKAETLHVSKKILTPRDYRFHFYAWWQEPKYRLDASLVSISKEDHDYFDLVEARAKADLGVDLMLDPDQRAWYVATREADFAGREERMWREYPSFPEEAFKASTEGKWLAKDMLAVRKRGGITRVPVLDLPVNTFWDIGNSDGVAIWFHQELRGEDRFIDYLEARNENLTYYVRLLRERGYLFGTHYLPHDADHARLSDYNKTTRQMIQDLMPGEKFLVVPRISDITAGIEQSRKHLKGAFFDEERCKLGIERLENYRKKFSREENRYLDVPDKSNLCSEGADAFRQYAQAKENGMLYSGAETNKYREAPAQDWRLT